MPVDSTAKTALVYTSIQLDPGLLSKYTDAVEIRTTRYDKGWLNIVECRKPKAYEDFNQALTAIEAHLKLKCFMPVLDDGGCTDGKIVLNPSIDVFAATNTWRVGDDDLIPGLKRLSKQLKVDFATNVHGSEGKRKREQTRTIYDMECEPPKKTARHRAEDTSLSSFAEKALDAVNQSHAKVIAAKDETISALTNALLLKEELVRTQASLISVLQKGSSHSP
jgi:hypothetical protein